MEILLTIVLGALAGWIASMVMGTDAQQGAVMNIILGIVGAVVGGMIFNLFGASGTTGFNLYSLIVATVGAIVLIWLAKVLFRRSV